MRRRLLVLLFGALMMSSPCFAATSHSVLSTQGWQSTGVVINQGVPYGVWQTGGKWTVDHRYFAYVDGAGYSPQNDATIFQGCKLNSSWPYGLLLGRIGNYVFPIGRGISFVAPQGGLLELSIHDHANCLLDNAGTLSVMVQGGLDVQGILNQLVLKELESMTPAMRQRLELYAANIAICQAQLRSPTNLNGPFTTQCAHVVLGLFSFVFNPQPAE